MKTSFKSFTTFFSILVVLGYAMTSCTNDDEGAPQNDTLYLSIPDVYFETKLIDQGIDSDGKLNQQLLKSDAEKVKILDLNLHSNGGDIADLTGIEGFVNLTLLSASNQELEEVDLRQNTLLDTLYLLGNKLSSIDLSENTNLVFLDLQSNQFESESAIIGLSNATKLKDLDLSSNYLEEFSIHTTTLEVLHMSHNDLKTLDTDGVINLQYVYMPLNQLETVDFSTNVNLKTLLLSGNKISEIALENNPLLTHLYVVDNNLKSLDVSNNTALEDLRINRNPELTCIKIKEGQNPYVMKSEGQELSINCN